MVTFGDEWLAAHSLQTLKLTTDHVLQKAKVTRDSKTTYNRDLLEDGEAKLKDLLTLYNDRIQWLQTGSRRWFGHIRGGDNIMLLVDSSERACDLGRVEEYSKALRCLVEEQLSTKSLLYCVHYGTDLHKYPPVEFSTDRENLKVEVIQSSMVQPVPRGHCNLLAALRCSLTSAASNDIICLLLCGVTDQDHDIIIDHMTQRLVGCTSPMLHLVAFNCEDDEVALLRRLAEITNSSFHHYSTCHEEQYGIVFDGDLSAVKIEAVKCQEALFRIQQAKAGLMNAPLIEILKELESSWTDTSDGCLSLDIAVTTDLDDVELCTSMKWLECNGIEGLGLNLFKLLMPDSIVPSVGYIPIINKKVSSVLNNASVRYQFSDGRMRKLHVDFPMLCYYQTRMDRFITTMERRIDYLTSESRRMFGLLAEKNVVIIVDTSTPVASHIIRLQEDLKLLIEQQLPLVDSFNFASFNSDCELWSSELVKPSPDTLAEAWMWVAMLKCEGTCNVMSALRRCLQLQTHLQCEQCDDIMLGVYLIMANEPDQDMVELHSYIEQCIGGTPVRLHVTYYGDSPTPTLAHGRYGDKDSVTRCLKYLATVGLGRFHRYTLSGNVIADDVEIIEEEIRKAIEYQYHVDCILQLYYNECVNHQPLPPPQPVIDRQPIRRSSAPPPRHNNASLARMNTINKRLVSFHSEHHKSSPVNITTTSFYLDWGLEKGHMRHYSSPVKKHSRNSDHMIPEAAVTMEICSQQWIAKYGMDTLRLPLSNYKVTKDNQIKCKKIFHYANKKGEVTKLSLAKKETRQYIKQLRNAVEVYKRRMAWLLSGSRQMFGVICEQRIVILVDCSASMATHWSELTNQVELLLNDQLIPRGIHFTMISFATSVTCYSDELLSVNRADIVVEWLRNIKPSGCTSMLDAIKLAVTIYGTEAILLVTDGNQDHTREYFIEKLIANYSTLPIHTVAYQCDDDRECVQFLKHISTASGGRFHHSSISNLGDDNQLLASEIISANDDLSVVSNLI